MSAEHTPPRMTVEQIMALVGEDRPSYSAKRTTEIIHAVIAARDAQWQKQPCVIAHDDMLSALRDFMLAASPNAKAAQWRALAAQAARKGRAAIAKATGTTP